MKPESEPADENQPWRRFIHRELVLLLVLIVVTVLTFFVTRAFAVSNRALRLADARAWYGRGEGALRDGNLDAALGAFQRASAKDPDEPRYRLSLANVLEQEHHDEAARQVLLDLRERQPEDPETNLQLARLETAGSDRAAVGHYYQTAIAGLWRPDQRAAQRQARSEFVQFLLGRGERDRALSELLVLETSLPDDLTSQISAAGLLLQAGDPRRSQQHYTKALSLDPDNPEALAGAAQASFETGEYVAARRYLDHLGTGSDRTQVLRALIDRVLDGDPLAARLTMVEREERLQASLDHVIARVEDCRARPAAGRNTPGTDLDQSLTNLRDLAATRPTSEGIETALEQIYRATKLTDQACPSADPFDRALVLIARRHGLED
jgi:Tfp pilus assembly protein PilF